MNFVKQILADGYRSVVYQVQAHLPPGPVYITIQSNATMRIDRDGVLLGVISHKYQLDKTQDLCYTGSWKLVVEFEPTPAFWALTTKKQ